MLHSERKERVRESSKSSHNNLTAIVTSLDILQTKILYTVQNI